MRVKHPAVTRPTKRRDGPATVVAEIGGKGGVGKSFMAVHLASGAALQGEAALVIEADKMPSLLYRMTGYTGPVDDNTTIASVILHPDEAEGIEPRKVDYTAAVASSIPPLSKPFVEKLARERNWNPTTLHLIPGSRTLEALDNKFVLASRADFAGDFMANLQIARAVDRLRPYYDWIFIDTAPSMSILQGNAIAACQHAILIGDMASDTIQYARDTTRFVDDTAAAVERLGRFPYILGIVLNKMEETARDRYWKHVFTEEHDEIDEITGSPTGRRVGPAITLPFLGTIAMDNQTVLTADDKRKPVHIYAPSTKVGQDLWQFYLTIREAILAESVA
jgi:cellulose biosynthesis protein BcsQ